MIELMMLINAYTIDRLGVTAPRYPGENQLPTANHLPGDIFIPTNINEDFFESDDGDEVMCRHDVSPTKVKTFLDGSYRAVFNFSYYMQSKNVLVCRRTLEEIGTILSIDNFHELFGLSEGRMQGITRPAPVSENDAKVKIYTSSFKLEFYQEV